MKTSILFAALLSGMALSGLTAQTDESKKLAVRKGENTINLYYGTNVLGAIYKGVAAASAEDLKVKSFGPIGLMYEHMVTDVIGLGLEGGYSQTTVSYLEQYSYYNSQNQLINDYYSYDLKFKTIRVMFRANFHFARSEKFDAYGLVSAGYRSTTFDYSTSDPYDNGNTLDYKSIVPFGIKPGIGIRYFFTPNFGLNLEIAAGTPLMSGGISLKF